MPLTATLQHRLPISLSASGCIACLVLLTAQPAAHAARGYPKAIKDAMANGVIVVTTFPAASGLTGWVLSQNGTYSIAFTTADRKTLIMGTLINEKGENLTDRYAEKYFPKPDRAALFKQLEQASHVVEGTAKDPKSVLYVFVDANSPQCRYLWKALQPYQGAGLQVRWIPVATLGASSMPKAIEILGSADKTAAFRKMVESMGKQWSPTQGLSESDQPELAGKIRKNTALMEKFGLTKAPGIVWKDDTGKPQIKDGMPRLPEIPQITGLPPQKVDDPELAKFK